MTSKFYRGALILVALGAFVSVPMLNAQTSPSGNEALNDYSTPIAFSRNTGSTPGASKVFQPHWCDLISIII